MQTHKPIALNGQPIAGGKFPLISMAMGPLGAVSRLVGGVFGSSLTFAVGAAASAPGQVPIEDLNAVLAVLQRARGSQA